MIHTSSYSNGVPADVTVSITKGYYRIYGNAWEVGEYTFFECRINYVSKESGESWSVISNSYNDYSGVFNATEKHASAVLQDNRAKCSVQSPQGKRKDIQSRMTSTWKQRWITLCDLYEFTLRPLREMYSLATLQNLYKLICFSIQKLIAEGS